MLELISAIFSRKAKPVPTPPLLVLQPGESSISDEFGKLQVAVRRDGERLCLRFIASSRLVEARFDAKIIEPLKVILHGI